MNKKVLLNNIVIAVIASLVIQFLPIIIREYLSHALITVAVGVIIGVLIPLFHRFIKPRTFLAWCILNIIVVCFSISLLNIQILLREGGFLCMLESYLIASIGTIIVTWFYYRKYKLGNQKLKMKQNEFAN